MRNQARRMAVCAMMAALSVVLMLLGAILELGMYAAPLFAGLCFIPVGLKYGRKYHALLYVTSGVLSLLLVPSLEESLIFVGLFGWYPMVRPLLHKLPRILRLAAKLAIFNGVIIAIESLVMLVLAPEVMEKGLLWVLFALGNITFLAYDFLIPRMTRFLGQFSDLL